MPTLAEIFERHDGNGFSRKELAICGRFELSTASNLFNRPCRKHEWVRTLIRRLPRPVQHDVLNDLIDGLPWQLVAKGEQAESTPPLRLSVRLNVTAANLSEEVLNAFADNRICDIEDARLESLICQCERTLGQLRDEKNRRRVRTRTA